jgi:predicted lipoprotein with Yx(FWY)xxD motif
MRVLATLLITGLLAVAACGGDDDQPAASPQPAGEPTAERAAGDAAPAPGAAAGPQQRAGTKLRVFGSDFGRMLFDSKRQAIYIFERDSKGRSVCYGACAEAWPPVFTDGKPVAGRGVSKRLLGSVKRRGGKRQVTYDGKPLYYYAHEGRGEVLCHDVNLNGGFWWVVGPDGERRP